MRVFLQGPRAQELAGEAQHDAVNRGGVVSARGGGRPARHGAFVNQALEHYDADPQRARGVPESMEGVPRGANRRDPGEALVAQVAPCHLTENRGASRS